MSVSNKRIGRAKEGGQLGTVETLRGGGRNGVGPEEEKAQPIQATGNIPGMCVYVQNHPHLRSTVVDSTWQTKPVHIAQRGLERREGRGVRQEKGKLMTRDFTADGRHQI